jgi:hypothetical protein
MTIVERVSAANFTRFSQVPLGGLFPCTGGSATTLTGSRTDPEKHRPSGVRP